MYLPRTLEDHILRLDRSFPVVMVTGARQVGKTTLLRHLAARENPPRNYVSLDELGPGESARDDPALFLQRHRAPLVIDEIQYAPGLLRALKPIVDRQKEMGSYWITGSQQLPLMRGVVESLAGRVGLVQLLGLSLDEELRRPFPAAPFRPDRLEREDLEGGLDVGAVFERIFRGTFPRFVHPDAPPVESFYGSYLQTYVERDVRALGNIADLGAFRRFLRLAAARVGQLLNLSDLAGDAGIAPSTAKEWLGLLEATFQVYLLRPYFENIGKRQIKTPKIYFRDTGLVCYLTGWTSAVAAEAGAMAGPLLECYVLSELLKSYEHRGRQAPIWFYRTKDKQEVAFLIAEDGLLFPIEVKRSASPSRRDLRGIRSLARAGAPLGAGAVISPVTTGYPLTDGVEAVPVSAIR